MQRLLVAFGLVVLAGCGGSTATSGTEDACAPPTRTVEDRSGVVPPGVLPASAAVTGAGPRSAVAAVGLELRELFDVVRANARGANLVVETQEFEDPDAEVVLASAEQRFTLVLTRAVGCPTATRVAVTVRGR